MGNKSKRKGDYGERRWAKLLMELTGRSFRKTPSSGGFNKFGGVKIAQHRFCGDVICDDPLFAFCVESKNRPNDFQPGLLASNAGPACFTTWWNETCSDADEVGLQPFLGFKIGRSANKDVGNDFVAMTAWSLEHLEYGGPRIVVDSYRSVVTVNVVSRKGVKKQEVSLPTPCIVGWRSLSRSCNPEKFFQPLTKIS